MFFAPVYSSSLQKPCRVANRTAITVLVLAVLLSFSNAPDQEFGVVFFIEMPHCLKPHFYSICRQNFTSTAKSAVFWGILKPLLNTFRFS